MGRPAAERAHAGIRKLKERNPNWQELRNEIYRRSRQTKYRTEK